MQSFNFSANSAPLRLETKKGTHRSTSLQSYNPIILQSYSTISTFVILSP